MHDNIIINKLGVCGGQNAHVENDKNREVYPKRLQYLQLPHATYIYIRLPTSFAFNSVYLH